MMGNWRKQKGEHYDSEITTVKSHNKKPPLGSWHPTVPSWEKKFCTSVGCLPWHKIMEMKRYVHLYDNVLQWDDSAGEEAFHNAKKRFYAKTHCLPCDLSLPDPDVYIDEIDWDSQIDPELLLDLDCEPVIPNDEKKYEGVVILDSLLTDHGFSSSGWGDCDEKVKKDAGSSLENKENPWDHNVCQNNGAVEENGWGERCWDEGNRAAVGDSGWGDGWNSNDSLGENRHENHNHGEWGDGWNSNDSLGENRHENHNHGEWGDGWNSNNSWGRNKYEINNFFGEGGEWGVDKGWREGTGRYMSRYKTSRFNDDNQRNQNGRKKVNYVSERQTQDSRPPSGHWNSMNSYAPVSRQSGDRWSLGKPVPI